MKQNKETNIQQTSYQVDKHRYLFLILMRQECLLPLLFDIGLNALAHQ